jgi:elongation factor Ts
MAEITAAAVKELRDRTGAGMMEAKKALVAANGDIELAIKQLRESGSIKAEKKAGRDTKEGRVAAHIGANAAALVAVLSETDFVAKNAQFTELVNTVATAVAESPAGDPLTAKHGGKSVDEMIKANIATIGENLKLGNTAHFTGGGFFGVYIHHNGKLGVLTHFMGDATDANKAMAREVAMHAAFTNPIAMKREQVPAELVAAEREVYKAKALNEGKPEKMLDKIVDGMVNAFYKDRVLLEQIFAKDNKTPIKDLIKTAGNGELVNFAYIAIG